MHFHEKKTNGYKYYVFIAVWLSNETLLKRILIYRDNNIVFLFMVDEGWAGILIRQI